jgi:hypothetical protein
MAQLPAQTPWLARKVYTSRRDKILDFIIGLVGWLFFNSIVFAALIFASTRVDGSSQIANTLFLISSCGVLMLNLGAVIVLAFTRHWIALGALAAFAALLALPIILGIVFGIACFVALVGGSVVQFFQQFQPH